MWRDGHVASPGTGCGRMPVGLSRETIVCNAHISCASAVNCEFGPWSSWGACSCSCEGVKERTRRISRPVQGYGLHCRGGTSQIAQCNPSLRERLPYGCNVIGQKVDCLVTPWSPWSPCSATCGTGQHSRVRSVKNEPKRGGRSCSDALAEVAPCFTHLKCAHEAVDCKWGEWSDWSACLECGGERERTRNIRTPAKHGGAPCHIGSSREIEACNPPLHSCLNTLYCVWRDWGHWGLCSSTCGNGHRVRRRILTTTKHKPVPRVKPHIQLVETGLLEQFSHWSDTTGSELGVAFGLGMISFLFVLLGVRIIKPLFRRAAANRAEEMWSPIDNRQVVGEGHAEPLSAVSR